MRARAEYIRIFCWQALTAALLCTSAPLAGGEDRLVVHEWGTFTALQDENGNAIGGINTDDEPVPNFVHDITRGTLLLPATQVPAALESKSVARCHADVTMRLETPVIYFYPSNGFDTPFDVNVKFFGGWLTQYFPDAVASAPGISQTGLGSLQSLPTGSLTWRDVSLTDSGEGPATDEHVWTTPRRVNSATVKVEDEREKYLFYRGVAHVKAPLRIVRSGPELIITGGAKADSVLWLADIRADGMVAFRVLRPFNQAPAFLVRTPATFQPEDYSAEGIGNLKIALQSALVNAGLFQDEADALLETWELSYFKSAGLRLFFLVPRGWTDANLLLTVSSSSHGECSCQGKQTVAAKTAKPVQAAITRVMIGRIEIVTPEQRALLAQISSGSALVAFNDFETRKLNLPNNGAWNEVNSGRKTFAAIGFDVPELYRAYLQLGRFRNALLLDEEKRHPSPELEQFIQRFHLEGYEPSRSP
jgi:hypothetical protein